MKSVHLLFITLLIPGMSNAQDANIKKENVKKQEVNMSTIQKNKEVIVKLYEQALNKRNMGLLHNLISAQYVSIDGAGGVPGFEKPILALLKAFPDGKWNIEELIGEGDKVVVRQKFQGTHTGPFQNFVTTGNTISTDGIAIYAFEDGKIIQAQVQTDRVGFLQQIEVLPSDLSLLSAKVIDKDHINFIDKFFVPANAKQEFLERVDINRNFIKDLPGFIRDTAYEQLDEDGNLIFITVAVWKNKDVLEKAKQAVQAEYKRQGFNPAEMFERLNITMDRGIYKEASVNVNASR